MGMYDTIWFIDSEAPKCVNGHPIHCFQTKGLNCNLDTYLVVEGGRVYHQEGRAYEKDERVYSLGRYASYCEDEMGETLGLVEEGRAQRSKISGVVTAYNGCGKCEPVYVYDVDSWSGDKIGEKSSDSTFKFTFSNGVIIEIAPVEPRTREELRAKLEKQGCIVLEDDNPIIVAHKMHKEGRIS